MKYIIAVSGGVDSVVLLDMLVKREGPSRAANDELIVAHFDHGIRPESDADARFVWALAKKYGLTCEMRREELGPHASEALARERRYAFLRDIANKYNAKIITAHHQDDLIETIVINLTRGTGWRGLAVFGDKNIERPLLNYSKQELRDYALLHLLEWVEDETNASDYYQRNRVRRRLYQLSKPSRRAILKLWNEQRLVRTSVEEEVTVMTPEDQLSRYFFIMLPESVGIELLRAQTSGQLTRPQLTAMLYAVKTFRPGQKFEAGNGIELHFDLRHFTMKDTSSLL